MFTVWYTLYFLRLHMVLIYAWTPLGRPQKLCGRVVWDKKLGIGPKVPLIFTASEYMFMYKSKERISWKTKQNEQKWEPWIQVTWCHIAGFQSGRKTTKPQVQVSQWDFQWVPELALVVNCFVNTVWQILQGKHEMWDRGHLGEDGECKVEPLWGVGRRRKRKVRKGERKGRKGKKERKGRTYWSMQCKVRLAVR